LIVNHSAEGHDQRERDTQRAVSSQDFGVIAPHSRECALQLAIAGTRRIQPSTHLQGRQTTVLAVASQWPVLAAGALQGSGGRPVFGSAGRLKNMLL
jgi:hypothetical protein